MKKLLLYCLGILVLAFIVCLPLILPFFKTGFFPTHDGEWAVVRLSDMYREIKDLQFPARYSGYLNFQYSYPLFNFTYPLPYYLGVVLVFAKLGFVNSIKILFSLSAILSFFSMFLLSKDLWKNKWAALTSAILYTYVPYRIVDLYVRGSIGESLSFVLFPLILLGIKKIYDKKRLLDVLFVGILYALLITTHNIMTVLFGIIILFIVLAGLFKKEMNFVIRLLLSLFLSLCFSAFFWVPAIFEKSLILLSIIPIADRSLYFVKPLQLIIPQWGYGTPTDPNPFGYQIGIPQLIIFVLAFIFALINIKKNKEAKIALFLIVVTLCISFLLFSQSAVVWRITPLLSEINYPWTLLGIIMFLLSLLAGYLSKLGKIMTLTILVLAVFAMFLFIPYAKPQYTVNRGDAFYLTNQATTTSSNELMPLWVKKLPLSSFQSKIEVASGKVENIFYNSKTISFLVDLPKSETIRINTIYYPGWEISVDGVKTAINYNNQFGVMEINVLAGRHVVKGEFRETPLRLFSDFVSLFSILGLVIYLIYGLIRKFRKT
jgi:hypothetical protein